MRPFFVAIALFGTVPAAHAAPRTSIPSQLLPAVKCIYGVLKSSPEVQSVDVYSIDDVRFGFKYTFRSSNGRPAVSYVELDGLFGGSVFLGDKIPREVPEHAAAEGEELMTGLHLDQKCKAKEVFDNLFPQPPAPVTWQLIDLPKDFH